MLFDDWAALWGSLVVTALAYVALILAVRAGGKRSLASLNAFDLVVTVALGSTLGTVAVTPGVTVASGAVVFATLIALQYVIALLSVHLSRFQRAVKARPTALLRDGMLLEDEMRRQRVARSEVLQAVRQEGFASLRQVQAVVLENDGSFSVIGTAGGGEGASTLLEVEGWS